jgi:hypothetical protein
MSVCVFYTLIYIGALTIRPPTNRPRNNSTQTKCPPDKPSAVTIYYCDIVHLYDSSTYFSSTLTSRWTICHLWHNIHPPKMLCDIMFTLSWSEIWTVCHKIFEPICDILPAVWRHVDIMSQDFSKHVFDLQSVFQQNMVILLHDFWTLVMSCRLLREMWTFCHRIFLTRLQYPAGFSAKCWCFVT